MTEPRFETGSVRRRAVVAVAVAVAAAVLTLMPARARADGAFPDSQAILTPADLPQQIILVTNFGLLRSEDAGASWLWACEQDANAFGFYYQQGLPPRRRLYALANQEVVFSDDLSCGWGVGGGLLPSAGAGVSDLWVDRTVVDRLLAVDVTASDGGARTYAVVASSNGGTSFDARLYQAAPGAMITGVESARTAPSTIYLTLVGAPADGGSPPALLAQTTDGGDHWTLADLTGQLGAGVVRLVAVDPADAQKVFLLWNGTDSQALAVTDDAGATARKLLSPTGAIKSFLRMASGTLLVATDDNSTAGLFRSRDGGQTFDPLPSPPHVRALSERAGTVFAATDNGRDGYAAGASTDEGSTWKSLLAYEDVRAIVPCLKATCQATCDGEVQIDLWPAQVCSADPGATTTSGSGGSGGSGGGGAGGAGGGSGGGGQGGASDAGADGGSAGGGGGAGAGATHGGCSCHAVPEEGPTGFIAGSLVLALVLLGARGRFVNRAPPGSSLAAAGFPPPGGQARHEEGSARNDHVDGAGVDVGVRSERHRIGRYGRSIRDGR